VLLNVAESTSSLPNPPVNMLQKTTAASAAHVSRQHAPEPSAYSLGLSREEVDNAVINKGYKELPEVEDLLDAIT
jgi:hypothetical protein